MSDCQIIFDKTKLAIERSLCTEIGKVVNAPRKSDEEIEVRFGYTFNSRNFSGISNVASESRERWYFLLRLLSSSELYKPLQLDKTLVESFGKRRKITNLGVPADSTYQDKTKLKTIDILNYKVEHLTHYIHLNISSEKEVKNAVTSGKPDFSRIRTRASFTAKDGSHRFDLTYVPEASYEVEIEYLATIDLAGFFKPIKLVMFAIKGNRELVTTTEYASVVKVFNSFFEKEARFDPTKMYKRALPQPINLKREFIPNMTAYSTTNKLNGTRMIGVIDEGNLYVINMIGQVLKIATDLSPLLNRTIFDSEYFKGTVYGFDLLFDKGVDVRNDNLDERLRKLNDIVSRVNNKNVTVKEFFMSGDLKADIAQTFEKMSSFDQEDNDGIIFTPITEPYNNSHIYKWKPPEMLTIDFEASTIGEGKYTLQVKDKNDKIVVFAPPGFRGIIESKEKLPRIGEYQWSGSTFVIIRARPDKEIPNFIDIAMDVWKDIQNPLSAKELLDLVGGQEGERDSIRKFHNSIKRELISKYLSNRSIIDLGAGKGGDLAKYQEAKISSLYAVEPNPVNLIELSSRAEAMKAKHRLSYKLELIPAKAQDTAVILAVTKGTRFSGGAMFFALSFFFETKLALDGLISTLDQTIDKDGLFIGTTIDGEIVRALFKKNGPNVVLGRVTLKKEYADFEGKIGFNKPLKYKYAGSETVADEQTEYLVDWDEMVKRMASIGFIVEYSAVFDPPEWMDETEQSVSKLYRSFVFKRMSLESIDKPKVVVAGKHLPMGKPGIIYKFRSVLADALKSEQKLDYDLVRIGTLGEGDCFFHAIKTATDTKYRRESTKPQQKKTVKELRGLLNVSEEKWITLGDGNLARIGSGITSPGFDTLFHNYMTSEEKTFMGYKSNITKAVGPYGIVNFLQQLATDRTVRAVDLPSYIKSIKKIFQKYIKQEDLTASALKELDQIIDIVKQEAYVNFMKRLKTCGSFVGQEVLEITAEYFERDIYILNDIDGDAYPTECIQIAMRKSIILLYQGGVHYETIGRNVNNKIQTEFDPTDPLLELIRKKIC